ncbi:MAG: hypothetical protein GY834_02360 [Bacteroidetes bacterium]|nr:hypothetical protein [Bacteroidota bacterium]
MTKSFTPEQLLQAQQKLIDAERKKKPDVVKDEMWWITSIESQITASLARARATLKQLMVEEKLIKSIKNHLKKRGI